MSYDGWIEWNGRELTDLGNMTRNVAPMWITALGFSLSRTDGWDTRLAGFVYQQCADVMRADPDKFKALKPSNGWGDYDGALRFMENAAEVCRASRDDAIVRWDW